MGRPGSGKRTLIHQLIDQRVAEEAKPADWCYVHNFAQPHKPRAIQLPARMGTRFHTDMQRLVSELQVAIPAVFEGDEYRRRLNQIDEVMSPDDYNQPVVAGGKNAHREHNQQPAGIAGEGHPPGPPVAS